MLTPTPRAIAGLLIVGALAVSAVAYQEPQLHLPPLDRVLPERAEAIYQAVSSRVDAGRAMAAVTFISPSWRLAGNPAYDRSLDYLSRELTTGGLTPRNEVYENAGQGWEPHGATLSLDTTPRAVVLSDAVDRLPLCINSFPTPAGGLVLPLVDVGAGESADFAGKTVTGALVLGDAHVGPLWTRAVRERGAAGVVSTALAAYTRPAETPNVLQWGSIPYDEARRSFGFKATPRAAERLRRAAAAGDARVHVEIAATFHRGRNRTLVTEFAGSDRPDERVVLVAHVQEPGANDNASGAGTLLAAALALRRAIDAGAVPAPRRTLTLLWLDEIRGSERWIADDPARAGRVMAMMSLDMTGQDTAKTGGTFLIEKSPDPSAIWPSPSDPHSEWGAGTVDRALVRGHLLNDLHLAVALRRARDTGWVVRTNPYEGGSDHTVFMRHGVPALLNWHFTDRYYHTNLDTPDKTSPETMGHVATAVATTALFLATAGESDRPALERLLRAAEQARAETEARNGSAAEVREAWARWYQEARASVAVIAR